MVEWKKLDTLLDFEHHSSVKKGRKFGSLAKPCVEKLV